MLKLVTTLTAGGALLLAGCAAPPAAPALAMQAVLRISHSPEQSAASWYQLANYHRQRGERDLARAAYAESIAQGARQRSAAPPIKPVPAPAAAAAAAPMLAIEPATRMELVQLAPQVYQLQFKRAERPAALTLATAPGHDAAANIKARPFRVAIANGNGAPGMAMLARQLITLRGIAVSRLSNERPYRQRQTEIRYPPGCHRQAQALKDALKGHAVMVRDSRLPAQADLRLVLGKDAILPMTLRQGLGPALAAN
jgi:hypothetical protein